MLTILLLTMLFGGGSAELFTRSDFRMVQRAIDVPERAEAASQSMQRINENLDNLLQFRTESFDQLSALDDSVTAPAAEYEQIFDRLWEVRRNAHSNYIDEVFVLRASMTREEWDVTFGPT
jgi:hypothetical protein